MKFLVTLTFKLTILGSKTALKRRECSLGAPMRFVLCSQQPFIQLKWIFCICSHSLPFANGPITGVLSLFEQHISLISILYSSLAAVLKYMKFHARLSKFSLSLLYETISLRCRILGSNFCSNYRPCSNSLGLHVHFLW